ncbi:hypothetical protein NC652_022299 [Populus alba x Populus x berolinensis]|nr:hypothetical protein NC652_022299 [Populus alba x Populus x berolinensis]
MHALFLIPKALDFFSLLLQGEFSSVHF